VSLGAAAQQNAGGRVGRPFVVVSVILHLLAFFFIVGVPRFLSSGPSGNKVYVVDLVTLPGGPAAAAPAPAPAAAAPAPELPKPAPVKPPEVKKAPETPKEPPKKAPKPIVLPDKDVAKKSAKTPPVKTPVPTKPAEPEKKDDKKDDAKESEESAADQTAATPPATNPAPSAAPAKPGAAAAPGATGTGGGGAGTGTGSGDEYDFYIAMLKKRIETVWKRPVSTSRDTRTAAVYFELSPTGRLLKLELRNPSGYVPFDRSIVQAVRDAEPFPPFPLALKLDRLAPTLEFELTPLNGGDSPP
jgi:protein TonB